MPGSNAPTRTCRNPTGPTGHRANWTHEEIAGHLKKVKGIRTSRSAVQRFCSGIGIRLYRPTYRHDRGDPVEQAKAKTDLAELGNGRRPANSCC
jgi:transposase